MGRQTNPPTGAGFHPSSDNSSVCGKFTSPLETYLNSTLLGPQSTTHSRTLGEIAKLLALAFRSCLTLTVIAVFQSVMHGTQWGRASVHAPCCTCSWQKLAHFPPQRRCSICARFLRMSGRAPPGGTPSRACIIDQGSSL